MELEKGTKSGIGGLLEELEPTKETKNTKQLGT